MGSRVRGRGLLPLCLSLIVSAVVMALAAPAHAAATTTVALWNMDEAAGATTMVDSSGNGRNGTVGTDVQTGVSVQGATAYRFPFILPNKPPARPQHLVTVPDKPLLDPDTADYAVSFRYRTTQNFGNVVQKGQNGAVGGYWKFEQPNGLMTCLFRNASGVQRAVTSPVKTNDGAFHTIRCERTVNALTLFVDGVQVRRSSFSTPLGQIGNNRPISIGGKSNCDQVEITCDYFVGDVDWVRIEKGSGPPPNQPPVASVTADCTDLDCTLDGTGSRDPDGTIQSYAWDFGDGATLDTGTTPTAPHTYAQAGTYTVTLTVTDDDGVSRSATTSGTVPPPVAADITFVGQASSSANAVTHSVTVPASVEQGDGLLLFFSQNTRATTGQPAGVTGWVPLDSQLGGSKAVTTVWRKVAGATDAGSTLRITLSAQSKGSLIVVAYRGTDGTDPVAGYAKATSTTSSNVRVTPTTTVSGTGAWAVSYWMHGDSTTTALVPPSDVTSRSGGTQTGSGRVTTLLADSAGPVDAGSYGGLAATAAAASTTTTTWTVILAPQT